MTLAIHAVQPATAPCYGNPADFCGAAEVTAQSRHLATVFTVSGDVDASNAESLSARISRLVLPGTGVVVDLSLVTSFAPDGALLIARIDEACRAAGVDWALVASRAVADRLALTDTLYPFVDSVPDALHRFADRIGDRRRLLLPMLTKSA
jgi:anti-anti-sigma regulatory factor